MLADIPVLIQGVLILLGIVPGVMIGMLIGVELGIKARRAIESGIKIDTKYTVGTLDYLP